jgi:hypothetical protein
LEARSRRGRAVCFASAHREHEEGSENFIALIVTFSHERDYYRPMLQIAQQFASCLDQTKFDDAAQLLAEDCTYHYFEGSYAGRANIVNIYRMLHKFGEGDFDEIKVSSEVSELPDGKYRIAFNDLLRIGEHWHALHSEEILTIEDGAIRHVEHISLPEESRALGEFLREVRA